MNAIDIIVKSKKILAISNYSSSKEIEEWCNNYDCIVRFNAGSNPTVLNEYEWYNGRVEVCVLNGYLSGYFGDLKGFSNKPILFSRPSKFHNSHEQYQRDYVTQTFTNKLKPYTDNISFIPHRVFQEIRSKYKYRISPTTGTTTLYYIKNYLNTNIEAVNFLREESSLSNFFEKNNIGYGTHEYKKELQILQDLKILNWKI